MSTTSRRGRSHHRTKREKSKKRKKKVIIQEEPRVDYRRLYTDFVDYVASPEVNKRLNPDLHVGDAYDDTLQYIVTSLKDVCVFDTELQDDIKAFYPGTRVKVEQQPTTEGMQFVVYIPIVAANDNNNNKQKKSSKRNHRRHRYPIIVAPPKMSVTNILVYVIVLLVVIVGASFTTTREEWAMIFSFLKK